MQVKFYNKKDLTENQRKEIRNLWQKAFNESKKNSPVTNPTEFDSNLLDETIVGLLLDEMKFIGMVFLLNPTKDNLNSEKVHYENIKDQGVTENDSYIYNFCIKKEYWRKGFGKYLLSESHNYIKSLGKEKAVLFVEDGNAPAVCLYNKAGYKVHRAGLSGFVMKKNLE